MLSQCSSRSFGSSSHSCRPERWPARAWPRPRTGPCVSKGCSGSPGQPAAAIDLAVALAEEGAKQATLHGQEPYVLVQGQFDRPGGQPPTRLSRCSKASSWLAVIRSSSSIHRHSRCVGPQTRVVAVSWGLDARVRGKSVSRACRSAGTDRQAHLQLLGARLLPAPARLRP